MQVVEVYSHKGGENFIRINHAGELRDVYDAVQAVDAVWCLRKKSKERTKPPLLFLPEAMNLKMKQCLHRGGWTKARLNFPHRAYREMDGIRNKVGLEIQFGKYAFMGYDIFSKMVIFAKHGKIECGIEVVGMPELVKEMSTGVSAYNQIVLDMKERGEADLDLPTLIIGVGLTEPEKNGCEQKRLRFKQNPELLIAAGEVSRGRKGASPGPKGQEGLYLEEGIEEEAEFEEQEMNQA